MQREGSPIEPRRGIGGDDVRRTVEVEIGKELELVAGLHGFLRDEQPSRGSRRP